MAFHLEKETLVQQFPFLLGHVAFVLGPGISKRVSETLAILLVFLGSFSFSVLFPLNLYEL